MQAAVPTGVHNPNSHTEAAILAALRGATGSRLFSFRYDLLDSTNTYIQALDNVTSCTIEQNWLAEIKRTATIRLQDNGVIDFLSDRIQPWIRLHLPPYGEDDWVEWPQGVFLLASPERQADEVGAVTRDAQAYDGLQQFVDDKTENRYTVAAGTVVTAEVSTLLGSIDKSITPSTSTLPVAREWEPGTSKLRIINDLLGMVNYESLSFDESGAAVVAPYVSPNDRAEEYTYADDDDSLIIPGAGQALDLFSVPNKWVLVVSEPDRAPLVGAYTNNDPGSLTSTVTRGRTIVDFRTEVEATDQAALDAKAERLAFEASQIYEAIEFNTGMNPLHSGNDVYRIMYGPLAVNAKYTEHTWRMDLAAGATMSHRARRVVSIAP